MDLQKILARKRQQLDSLEAQLTVLRDEVATLGRALEIAAREEGKDIHASSRASAPVEGAAIVDKKVDTPPPAKPEPLHVVPADSVQRPTGLLIGLIREIVRDLPEPFSTVDVRNEIKRRDPDLFQASHYSSISGTMRRMTGKELVAVEKGGPGKEATYRLANNSQTGPEHRADTSSVEGEHGQVESTR